MGLIDLFIERTPDDKKPEQKQTQPAQTAQPNYFGLNNNQQVSQPVPVYQPQRPVVDNQVYDKFMAHFDELLKNSNLPGPDYYEFSKMVESMSSLTDEVRMPAAFSALNVQGLTKDKLISTAKQYIEVIDNDSKNFSSALDTKVLAEIEKKKAGLQLRIANIKQKEDLIEKMKSEIIQEKIDIDKDSAGITSEETKYNEKTTVYKSVCELKKQNISSDIDKISKLIK